MRVGPLRAGLAASMVSQIGEVYPKVLKVLKKGAFGWRPGAALTRKFLVIFVVFVVNGFLWSTTRSRGEPGLLPRKMSLLPRKISFLPRKMSFLPRKMSCRLLILAYVREKYPPGAGIFALLRQPGCLVCCHF
jgi:hypothetical protein